MNILFIDIDTLRPDHMGCYGYSRNTTPNMDKICSEGVRFDRVYCSDAPCLPSRAALISGMFGIKNGVVGHGGTAGDRFREGPSRDFHDTRDDGNFNAIFRNAGLYTASVSTFPERHSAWWFSAGMQETFNQGNCGRESGETVLPYALDWLDRNGHGKSGKDWYLHVHFWDPHTPYRAPAEFGNPFENEPIDDIWIDDQALEKHLHHTGPHGANEINMWDEKVPSIYPRMPGQVKDRATLKQFWDGYDCGVAFADMLVGQIFDKLREMDIYDNTAIIITSDHGENLGELGLYAEHGTADHPTCHIPLIIRWPGGAKGIVAEGLHYQLDLAPTMAELLGTEKNPSWDGESFAEAVLGNQDTGRASLVISQMAHVCQRSAVFGDWLYMRTIHDGYHLFDKEMLYHLSSDPYEQKDVKEQYPEKCAEGARIILNWQEKAMSESQEQIDPMWTVMRENGPYHTWGGLQDYLVRLEATGRADGAARLREKYLK